MDARLWQAASRLFRRRIKINVSFRDGLCRNTLKYGIWHFVCRAKKLPLQKTETLIGMRIPYLLIIIIILCGHTRSYAQPLAEYDAFAHDLGTLTWHVAGLTSFQISNIGNEDLLIKDVRTDCGCTVVTWTHDPIRPGESGTISATFDAEMLGHFSKHIAVYTNTDTRPVYLRMDGVVVIEKKEYSGDFPVRIGDIYLDTDVVEFDDVNRGETPMRTILVFNGGKKSYAPELMHLPKYLEMEAAPEVIRPGRVGRINLTLNSDALHDMGLTQTDVYLSRFPGDRVSKESEINVSATLLPPADPDGMSLENAPVIALDSTMIDLGAMGGRKKVKGSITITNKGNSPLQIHTLQVYNPGISASLAHRTLKPGASEKLKITISANSNYFKGRRRILLITNDPQSPKTVIDVRVKK